MMWMEFECETSLTAKTPETRQHFLYFLYLFVAEFSGFIESEQVLQLYFHYICAMLARLLAGFFSVVWNRGCGAQPSCPPQDGLAAARLWGERLGRQ